MEAKKEEIKYIVVPDVHGRTFWKKEVDDFINGEYPNAESVIFLGDYLDPYISIDGIGKEEAFEVFNEILSIANNNDKIKLLIGNHDYHYIRRIDSVRIYAARYNDIKKLFTDNKKLFSIAYEGNAGDKKLLFTHAGVTNGWFNYVKENATEFLKRFPTDNDIDKEENKKIKESLRVISNIDINANTLNGLFEDWSNDTMMFPLEEISYVRGGYNPYGSPIWADVNEHIHEDEMIGGYYQVFGHSFAYPTLDEPYICDRFAMLDSRKSYGITENGEISEF